MAFSSKETYEIVRMYQQTINHVDVLKSRTEINSLKFLLLFSDLTEFIKSMFIYENFIASPRQIDKSSCLNLEKMQREPIYWLEIPY